MSQEEKYDPMSRINNFNLTQSYENNYLSEYDTESARLLRAMDEKFYSEAPSESYNETMYNNSKRFGDVNEITSQQDRVQYLDPMILRQNSLYE